MHKAISQCRVCENKNLSDLLTLGDQALTGIFPSTKDEYIPKIPLSLVKCVDEGNENYCGLVQLKHSYDLNQLYGENYGYRSGLNSSMVNHLKSKVETILKKIHLEQGAIIIDIGSNDATTLKFYPKDKYNLIGIDPTAEKFREYYPSYITLIPKFFSLENINNYLDGRKAKIITSFSMFYDLEEPLKFMQEIYDILDDDGVWCFEQSYMPTMLEKNSFDTICHEHLEYYHLKPILWMCQRVGFKVVDISFNEVNGGSISLMVSKTNASYHEQVKLIETILEKEYQIKLDTLKPYLEFSNRIESVKTQLINFFRNAKDKGEKILGLGASTKGNVILQYCGFTSDDLLFIGEVNPSKFGKYTPGSLIPIIHQEKALSCNPDYLFILPWHFHQFFNANERISNFRLIYPLPTLTQIEQRDDKILYS